MSFLNRQRLRPGIGGVSSRPVDPAEAYRVENMILQRDGVWKPRPGLVATGSAVSTITHIANLDFSTYLAVIEGGRLRTFETGTAAWGATLSSGWPEKWIKHACGGGTAAKDWYWLGVKAPRLSGSTFGDLHKINANDRTSSVISGAPQGGWVDYHGVYTFSVGGSEIAWSSPGDSDTWSAADSMTSPRFLRFPQAIISLSESQALLLGDFGVGQLMGNTPENWTVGPLYRDMILWPRTAVSCGDRVFVLGGGEEGTRVYFFNPGMYRVDAPIESELAGLNSEGWWAWYDPLEQNFCMSHSTAGKTWIFDLEKNRWAGTISRHLVGFGMKSQNHGFSRVYGLGGQLVVSGSPSPSWADSAGSYSCIIETRPDFLQAPETEKQASAVFVDGRGDWTVTLRHRERADEAWTDVALGSVSAPGWVHAPLNVYRERVLRFEGTPSATLRFRGIEFDERVVGLR